MRINPIIIIRAIGIFAMLIGSFITGGLTFIAGIGIILRQNWARWMGLIVFALFSFLLLAVVIANIFMSIISENYILISMIICSLLFALCFWLLTRKEIIAEFRRKKQTIK